MQANKIYIITHYITIQNRLYSKKTRKIKPRCQKKGKQNFYAKLTVKQTSEISLLRKRCKSYNF